MARYLVTGGCGFIGSHLCEALIGSGNEVRVLDDLSTGAIAHLPTDAELIRADVADLPAVEHAMSSVDGCFHLAAITSVSRSTQDWIATHRVNLTGSITVFEAAKRCGNVPVVYASSAAVYGDSARLPMSEDVEKNPISAYGADKLGGELHARVAAQLHGVPTIGLRFFNVYGPRQDPKSAYSGVISIFCDQVRRKIPITIFGSGQQTRDFIYVEDVVNALIQAQSRHELSPGVFNTCTGIATPIANLANLIGVLYGKQLPIHFDAARSGDIMHSVGDPDLAHLSLGFTAVTPLRVGLTRTIEWLETTEANVA